MRRVLLLSCGLVALFLAACSSAPKNGECSKSDDCRDQQGYGKVCVQGRCQECGIDTDCQAGFVCRENKCTPRPECAQDADCGSGRSCQAGKCIAAAAPPKAECENDVQCGSGRACQAGKCVTAAAPVDKIAACSGHNASDLASGEDNFVHFDFDKASLRAEDQAKLQKLASCLKQANASVVVEGHCDQRGTADYNIQLGQRRAESVKKYLDNLGVGAVQATSYGKERTLCDQDQESCWKRNRRAVLTGAAK